MKADALSTFKGKPIEYYVRVEFGYEQGSIINGVYTFLDFSF